MGTRFRGNLVKAAARYRTLYANGNKGPWQNVTSSAFNLGYSDSVSSVRGKKPSLWRLALPGEKYIKCGPWKRVRVPKRGPHLPPNPFSHSEVTGRCESSRCVSPVLPGYEYEGQFAAFAQALPSANVVPAGVWGKAAQLLYRRASDSEFEGYLQFGEAIEAVQMLRAPLTSLTALMNDLWKRLKRDTRFRTGESLRKTVSSAWLEYQFGVAPLVFQTGGIVASLYDAVNPNSPSYEYKQVKVGWKQVIMDTHTVEGGTSERKHIIERKVLRVRAGGWLRRSSNRPSLLAERLGLHSMRHITAQAYALLPLSFAVDWIVGIGPLLEECRPLPGDLINTWASARIKSTKEVGQVRHGGIACNSYACFTRNTTTRITDVSRTGTLFLGPGIRSLNQAITSTALASGITDTLWKRKPWQ